MKGVCEAVEFGPQVMKDFDGFVGVEACEKEEEGLSDVP